MSELEKLNWLKNTDKQVANLVSSIFFSSNVMGVFVLNIE